MLTTFLQRGDSDVSLWSVPSNVAPCSIFSRVAFSGASLGPGFGSRPQNTPKTFQGQLWVSLNTSGTEGIGKGQEEQARTQEKGLSRGSGLSGESSRKTDSLAPDMKNSPQPLLWITYHHPQRPGSMERRTR